MGFKLVSAILVLALALSGPLAPLAWAQEKGEGQMAPAKQDDRAWQVAAAVTNVVHVPGKALLCLGGGITGVVFLLASFGSGYTWAGRAWEEGCAGKWVVTVADIKPTAEDSSYISDQPDYRKSDYQRTE